MTGRLPLPPSIPDMRVLLEGARALGGAQAAVLELCLLALCRPFEAVAIDIERIDWATGRTRVPRREGGTRILPLPEPARRAILRIAGERQSHGQAVTGGRGRRLEQSDVRLDRLTARLSEKAPSTARIPPWNLLGIRMAARHALIEHGSSMREANAAVGVNTRLPREKVFHPDPWASLAAIGLETWCGILLDGGGARTGRE